MKINLYTTGKEDETREVKKRETVQFTSDVVLLRRILYYEEYEKETMEVECGVEKSKPEYSKYICTSSCRK